MKLSEIILTEAKVTFSRPKKSFNILKAIIKKRLKSNSKRDEAAKLLNNGSFKQKDGIYDVDNINYMILSNDEADDILSRYMDEAVYMLSTRFLMKHIDAEDAFRALGNNKLPDDMSASEWFDEEYRSGLMSWVMSEQKKSQADMLLDAIRNFDDMIDEILKSGSRDSILSNRPVVKLGKFNAYIIT